MTMRQSYRLSRIQAEGWNAARANAAYDPDDVDEVNVGALSPYRKDPEKARWVTGFCSAFKVSRTVPK